MERRPRTGDPSTSRGGVDPSKPKCRGHKAGGEPCGNYPLNGAVVCRYHGGSAPQVREAAARRVAAAEAVAELRMLGTPVQDADPALLVLSEIAHSAGYVQWLRERVMELDPAAPIRGDLPPWLRLYDEERDRLVRWSDVCVRMGVTVRRTELAEQVGAVVTEVLREVLNDLQLTPSQRAVAATAIPQRLRTITGALAPIEEAS